MLPHRPRHYDFPGTLEVFDFRLAAAGDVSGLVEHYQQFFADSTLPGLGLVYDPKRAGEWALRMIETGESPHVIAIEKAAPNLVGCLNYYLDHTSTEKPFAYVDKFYVRPGWRLSAIGRVLVDVAMDMMRGDGAVALRAGVSSGGSGGGMARNLFLNSGFHECQGSVLFERSL
jgi:GNAT superfamily N-acetyltransferase